MLKNLAYTLPTVGRVVIGELVQEDGKRHRPQKNNHFSVTSQVKKNGAWVPHPVESKLATDKSKLRSIPIKVVFNEPNLSIRDGYAAFDNDGRQVCAGDGAIAKRLNEDGQFIEEHCPGSEYCSYGKRLHCKTLGRFVFEIALHDKPMELFILRSSGFNTIRALRSRLVAYRALFGSLVGLPLNLVMRAKSSKGSHQSTFYYLDIELQKDLVSSAKAVQEYRAHMAEAGLNQDAFEEACVSLLEGNPVEELSEDSLELEELGLGQNGFVDLPVGGSGLDKPSMSGMELPPQTRGPGWLDDTEALQAAARVDQHQARPLSEAVML